MRAMLLGQDSQELLPAIAEAGIQLVDSEPDACICYGGDGTLLGAERDYPGIPKIPIRRRESGGGDLAAAAEILRRVVAGDIVETRLPKLEARTAGQRLFAINDIIVRNSNVTAAVRFSLAIDGYVYFEEIVGDGLVVATPFGSTAYYRSITNSVIHVGIGVAFNNSTEPVNHLVLGAESRIRLVIKRGPALLAADNNPRQLPLREGDVVDIEQAAQQAVFWEIQNLLQMDRPAISQERRLRWLHSMRRGNGLEGQE